LIVRKSAADHGKEQLRVDQSYGGVSPESIDAWGTRGSRASAGFRALGRGSLAQPLISSGKRQSRAETCPA
jgi:hypothetical protein